MKDNVLFFYESIEVLKIFRNFPLEKVQVQDIQPDFKNGVEEIVRDLKKLKFVTKNKRHYDITKNGINIISRKSPDDQLCSFVVAYIKHFYPGFLNLLTSGRKKAQIFLPDFLRQILNEAKIFLSDHKYEKFAQEIHETSFKYDDSRNREIGKMGEKLSLQFEKKRIGKMPEWIALEDDGAGYDIKSQVNKKNNNSLYIEVKTTLKPLAKGIIYITRNEWETAKIKSEFFLFHIWVTQVSKQKPFIISPAQITKHVPKERGSGKWNDFSITTKDLLGK